MITIQIKKLAQRNVVTNYSQAYQVIEIDINGDKIYRPIEEKINVDELIALQNKAAQA